MTRSIDELRGFLRGYLLAHPSISEIPSKTATSGKAHLSAFRTKARKPIGFEFDKDTLQNIWLRAQDAPPAPSSTKTTEKHWTGTDWKSPDGKGANSNLSAYDDFHGHDLIRYGVKSKEDAVAILEHVLR
ncbi:hypothetical protein K3X48_05915 [Aliiroseovarius crassostreae]|uniref:Uncharacterized protein n=1 Tax=Aliiroseovarius crassostreae TaxID=154981 RepID=A0A9Q9LUM8_9RHOB|nr:hypothetical protein [Aliiroseovarius crassostreae]UWP96510.1 hypothetical protein K3X48_05915 [Aliiroseovarius crassostreae]